MYERAVKYIVQYRMQGQFEERCRQIVADTSEMGWGFHDQLSYIFEEYFKEESTPHGET